MIQSIYLMTMLLPSSGLEAFSACAKELSFTRAAKALHITQSALSQRIKNLENELELTLFVRGSSGIQLTETAEELLKYCQVQESLQSEVLSVLRGTSQEKMNGFSGEVRIAGFSSINQSVVLPAIAPLIRVHPRLNLKIMTRELDRLTPLLKSGEADFILHDRTSDREGVESILLGHESYVLVEKKNDHGPEIYLDHDERDDLTHRYLELMDKKKSKKIRRRYFEGIDGIIHGVELGLGRAVAPKHLIQRKSNLRVLNAKTILRSPVFLQYRKSTYYTRLHLAVVENLKQEIPKYL